MVGFNEVVAVGKASRSRCSHTTTSALAAHRAARRHPRGEQGTLPGRGSGDGPSRSLHRRSHVGDGARPAFATLPPTTRPLSLMLATCRRPARAKLDDPNAVSGAQVRDAMRKINDRTARPGPGRRGNAEGVKLLYIRHAIDYRGAPPATSTPTATWSPGLPGSRAGGKSWTRRSTTARRDGLSPPMSPHAER